MAKRVSSELASMFVEGMPVCSEELYAKDILFLDPLNKFTGVEKYQKNIQFLKKSPVFDQTRIVVHSVSIYERPNVPAARRWTVCTRWTLSMRVAAAPWRPTVLFTGTSDYVLDATQNYVVCEHVDKWDSLAPDEQMPFSFAGMKDVLSLVFRFPEATNKGISQPTYSILRRAREYEVRKYDPFYTADVAYETRPEGLARLDAYYGGANDLAVSIPRTVPVLLEFADGFDGKKKMCGILPISAAAPPKPTAPWIELRSRPSTKLAAFTFGGNLTPEVAKYYYQVLLDKLERDGICRASPKSKVSLAQFSAVYTVPWQKKHEIW
eukprot:CAMPEP_0185841404 /NCGR_PEP_ID=MMETSP1353-20130828/17849_1 /TAXON_ID=1077150 /ORGANISM="Erythrolobus australicus, Strain CCMP3124" /LENGTH=322 /DNA_ID=CAMNT_0028540871 /DNA_START=126 /DNA_END=1091 /DNA_ORIENTATION=+